MFFAHPANLSPMSMFHVFLSIVHMIVCYLVLNKSVQLDFCFFLLKTAAKNNTVRAVRVNHNCLGWKPPTMKCH